MSGSVRRSEPAVEERPATTTPGSRRQTRQRSAVTAALGQLADFRSAQDLYEVLRAQGEPVGLTTVYRTLAALASDGEVDVIVRADGQSVYRQCSASHHHHLVCLDCGRTVEVAGAGVERWAATMAVEHGFSDVTHTLEIFGRCRDCPTS